MNLGIPCELEEIVPVEKLLSGFVLTEHEAGWGSEGQCEEG